MITSTVLGSVLGFAGSALAPVVSYFEKKNAGKLEINKLEKAIEMKNLGFEQDQIMYGLQARDNEHKRLIDHDMAISKGTGIVASIQKLVRPLITYAFFALFATVEGSLLYNAMQSGDNFTIAIGYVWDEDTKAIFAAVMSFWFGQRAFEKIRSGQRV